MELKQKIHSTLDSYRGHREIDAEAIFDAIEELKIDKSSDLEEFFSIATKMVSGYSDLFIFDKQLISFIQHVVGGFEKKHILIPWAEAGILAKAIEESKPSSLTCYDRFLQHSEFLKSILHESDVKNGDPYDFLANESDKYDLILGCPPFNLKSKVTFKNRNVSINSNYTDSFIAASLERLNKNGQAVFILPPSFLNQSSLKKDTWSLLSQFGVSVKAIIELPPGQWQNITAIPSLLIIFEKGEQRKVFSAVYSDSPEIIQMITKNYQNERAGKRPKFGSLEDLNDFKGAGILEDEFELQRISHRAGLTGVKFDAIAKNIKRVSLKKESPSPKDNTIIIPLVNTPDIVTSFEDPRLKQNELIQVELVPELANAEFVAEFLNHSPIGEIFRQSVMTSITLPRVLMSSLKSSTIYLPDIMVQNKAVEVNKKIRDLNSELSEIQNKLWTKPQSVEELSTKIATVNREESFTDWIDTLPYPLASILWSYHVKRDSKKEQYEKLLHFFEATSEFYATLLLSIVFSSSYLKSQLLSPIKEQLKKNNMAIERTSFGLWNTVYEFLAKALRKKLSNPEEKELMLGLLNTHKPETLNMLLDKRLATILKTTNTMRNEYLGHAGATGQKQAIERLDKLTEQLSIFRAISTGTWNYFSLIRPDNFQPKSNMINADCKLIMGTKTPFEHSNIEVKQTGYVDMIYLYAVDTGSIIRLLPFIKILTSKKTEEDGCYFFNKTNKGRYRYVSYHYEPDPEQFVSCNLLNDVLLEFQEE